MRLKTHRKALATLVVIFGLAAVSLRVDGTPPQATARTPESQVSAAQLLAGREMGPTPLLDDLRELCDGIGGRPTGSKACERAVDWAVGRFRAAGVDSVWTESYTMPGSWEGGSDHAECMAPVPFTVRVASAPGTAPTPGGRPLEAPLVVAGDGSPEAFAALGERANGAIALVLSPEMKTEADLFAEYTRDGPLLAAAERARVAALLIQAAQPRLLLYRHPMGLGGDRISVPAAIVARAHAARLARLADHGEVRLRLELPSRVGGSFEARNVVAEIRGREKPNEIVLIGAHLDSWDLGTGAEDDGVNATMIIDVARSIKALGLVPRRTLRFALFTGEEQGMLGSEAYVLRHADEIGNHVAMIAFDTGSGRISGFYLNGREELRQPVNQALAAVGNMQVTGHTLEAIDGTDNFDFLLSGIPNLVAMQEWAPYLPNYHAESDVYDVVNGREAKTNAAIAAALIWGLAQSPDRPAPRQGRAEVEKLLRDTKLEDQMKGWGQWQDFASGKRGVSR
jgi:carboxypeptidase Q